VKALQNARGFDHIDLELGGFGKGQTGPLSSIFPSPNPFSAPTSEAVATTVVIH